MDMKTLEYLEERAGKGRGIVKAIEKLKEMKADLEQAKTADIYCGRTTIRFSADSGSVRSSILAKMMSLAKEEIDAEIARLEEELAAL